MTAKSTDAKKSAKKLSAKTNGGPVDLVLLLDESGSMGLNVEAVTSGVNEFLDSFKGTDARVTIAMFDAHPGAPRCRIKVKSKPVAKVKMLTAADYTPRGMTPLHDAVCDVVAMLDEREAQRAFVVILTDGLENASENTAETVAKLIKKRERKGWAFLYLGSGHDAHAAAATTGMAAPGQSFNYAATPAGNKAALRTASGLAAAYYGDSATYKSTASALAASTGGKITDDDE